jgi:hypothetical protein
MGPRESQPRNPPFSRSNRNFSQIPTSKPPPYFGFRCHSHPTAVDRSLTLAKSDKGKIAVWKRDLVRVLHVFNVRSSGLSSICKLNSPLSDRVCNRHQHWGYGYSRGGCRYPGGGCGCPGGGGGYPKGGCGHPHSGCRHLPNGCQYSPKRTDRTGRYF